jgi:hypothetical protein
MKKLTVIGLVLLHANFLAYSQQKTITVEVRRNIEVLSTLNNQISTSFLKDSVADPFLYKNTRLMRMNYDHFKKYEGHPAIVATQQMSDRIGTGVYLLGLFYDEFPKVTQIFPISEPILKAIHEDMDSANLLVNNYILQVAGFYRDSNFDQYFANNSELYQLAILEVEKNLPGSKFIKTLESYYGAEKASYHIVAMPSFKSGWGMAWEIGSDGKKEAFNIIAPLQEQITSEGVVTQAGFNNPGEIRNLSVHEFGHTFVNPLTQSAPFEEQISRYAHLFKPIPNQGQYSDWLTSFNEHIVRAGEIRIASVMGNDRESERLRFEYKDWMYLSHFIEELKKYEHNRKKYPTFKSFLPALINSLKTLK